MREGGYLARSRASRKWCLTVTTKLRTKSFSPSTRSHRFNMGCTPGKPNAPTSTTAVEDTAVANAERAVIARRAVYMASREVYEPARGPQSNRGSHGSHRPAERTLPDAAHHEETGALSNSIAVLVLSYPWLDAEHPDKIGESSSSCGGAVEGGRCATPTAPSA